ncbi:MAG: DUF3151 domain-containing protein [Dermatophilaceae bacterium]
MSENLFGVKPTLLPEDPAVAATGLGGEGMPADRLPAVAAAYPSSSLAWALLAEAALGRDDAVSAYAFARTGYHRGLDQLRRAGWRGQGPIPWAHEPNRGFLRSLAALARAARVIGESDEEQRCGTFLRDSSREAADALGL